ncbi:acetyl-CoA synthetase-like protein [Schizophyllum commune H4-8]|uniref:acetyl-CoA synthetase-like protein n=1 Tax=Schizophyllum commune (strain H4-8 / FGSC 9210) TaxID=578458 RepID=UPI00215EA67A|nr:acetyl-CoA synthetase-like protein [Schizophyllum commune H4-8]KAI5884879.1 acetyl-CoA synthetase-like protein [Schizophyllum commune H4-8]
MSDEPWIPKNTVEETLRLMTAPGALLETETACIDGRVYSVYKNLPASCRALWLQVVRMYGDREYVVFEEQRYTFRAAHEQALKTAAMFRDAYGIGKGDHVGIVSRNIPDYLVVFWACHLLGAVPALVNCTLTQESIKHSIILCDCKLILLDPERADLLEPAIDDLLNTTHAKDVLVLESHEGKGWWKGTKSYSDELAKYEGDGVDVASNDPGIVPEDDAIILFSSGTGSLMPKACLSTQRALLTNLFNVISNGHRATIRRGEKPVSGIIPPPMGVFYPTPIFGAIGISLGLLATFMGAKLVYVREYKPSELASLIRKEDIKFVSATQNAIHDLIDLASTELQGHRFITVGVAGGAVHKDFARRAREAFPGAMIGQGYGMTEMNASCVTTSAEDFSARPLSCGTRVPVVDAMVVDENGRKLPPGHTGEIWVRGPNAMKCYYGDPEATAKFMTKDGWCKTGDIGAVCAEGFVYITDRKKDMIIRDGLNVGSISIENALYAHPGVSEAAAVPVPDERSGELPVAVAVVKEGHREQVTEEGLLELLRKKLPKHAVPLMIVLTNEPLKRNAAGKVLKIELKESMATEWQKRKAA